MIGALGLHVMRAALDTLAGLRDDVRRLRATRG